MSKWDRLFCTIFVWKLGFCGLFFMGQSASTVLLILESDMEE